MLKFCDFIQVLVFTTNHHFKHDNAIEIHRFRADFKV